RGGASQVPAGELPRHPGISSPAGKPWTDRGRGQASPAVAGGGDALHRPAIPHDDGGAGRSAGRAVGRPLPIGRPLRGYECGGSDVGLAEGSAKQYADSVQEGGVPMSRPKRVALWVGGGLAALIVVVFLAGIATVRTGWFRNMVREKIVAAVETGTGGRAEIGSFTFDWTHLRPQIRNFTAHGVEPADAATLLHTDLLQVDLKLLSPFRGFVGISYLLVERPRANVIVYPDGHTNVPSPKVASKSDKSALETVVDLAVGKFDLRRGTLKFAGRQSELNLSGENLHAVLGFNPVSSRYLGEVDISLPVTLEKDRIGLTNALLRTPKSQATITGAMDHLAAPSTTAHVVARLAIDEVKQLAALGIPLDTAHGPAVLNADITASMDDGGLKVQNAKVNLGQTNIEANGTTRQVQFQSTLA